MQLNVRSRAVDRVLAKFNGKPFKYGTFDCMRLAAEAAKALGHTVPLVKAGGYSTARGAIRALKRYGFDRPEGALDALFPRIGPAFALPGDIIAFESGEANACMATWPAMMVAVGNGRVLGFKEGVCGLIQPEKHFVTAWHIPENIRDGAV